MLRKGTKIIFEQMNDFTGKQMRLQGEIVGHAKEIKKMWPEECGAATDPVYLVKRKDVFNNILLHVVFPEELVKNPFEQLKPMQAHKAKVRVAKEKQRRENYFK